LIRSAAFTKKNQVQLVLVSHSTCLRKKTIVVEDLPGVLPPVGFFDPLDLSGKASDNLIRQYREAELTHGRVSMIAALGFLTGEAVQGVTPLFGGPTGAGVVQFGQVPSVFWVSLAAAAFAIETYRVKVSVNDIVTCSEEEKGKIRADYVFGDLGFDPLGLKPTDPEEFKIKQSKELQNGRLAMIGAAGILAQELVNKQGVFENLVNQFGIEIPTLAF